MRKGKKGTAWFERYRPDQTFNCFFHDGVILLLMERCLETALVSYRAEAEEKERRQEQREEGQRNDRQQGGGRRASRIGARVSSALFVSPPAGGRQRPYSECGGREETDREMAIKCLKTAFAGTVFDTYIEVGA
jgi:hypothetical protein